MNFLPSWFASLLFLLVTSVSMTTSIPLCKNHDKLALLKFKQIIRTECDESLDPTSTTPKTESWKADLDCCLWDGIECDEATGHVTSLDLSSSCLHGTLPPNSTLFSLTHLRNLNLAFNDFNLSRIPTEISHLDELTSLNLSSSSFSGQITSQLSKLSRLSLLDLSFNGDHLGGMQFSLRLHKDHFGLNELVSNLTNLKTLRLDGVDISSYVPVSLANLTSLRLISLAFCNLQGKFPSSVFKLPNLETIYLAYNGDLQGSLPEFEPNSRLKRLFLISTAFSGVLPSSIGNLKSLEILELWNSHFSGYIPSSIGNLTKLTVLDLGYNDFKGDIPSSITNLSNIGTLDLSRLNVSPEILIWVGNLKKLTQLGLGGIGLGSEVPSFLANHTKLTYLDLSSNQLTGGLPHWFANLTQLISLHLEENHLQGMIPEWFPDQFTNLDTLNLSYNSFFGSFDRFLKHKNIRDIDLSGLSLTFPSNTSTNYSSIAKFNLLALDSCNLTEFPVFLRQQNELQFLSFRRNNIKGSIPEWFVDITRKSLLSLHLSNNNLTGFEQFYTVIPWPRLETLDLSFNSLRGSILYPPDYLLTYRASNNMFTGVLTDQLCSGRNLYVLDLSNNNMNGRIPHCLSEQLGSSLLVLNLRGNKFHGIIPPTYRKSCKLKMIDLSGNLLEGDIPRSLANCEMLEVLDIGENSISDTFPSWLGNLAKLQVLILRHNKFHGRIAARRVNSGVHDFRSLRVIDLSYNSFVGVLPWSYLRNWEAMKVAVQDKLAASGVTIDVHLAIMQEPHMIDDAYGYSIRIMDKGNEMVFPKVLNVFKVIDFSSNKFIGRIPDSIGSITGVQALNLSNNHLEGIIPSSLANLRALESLDLSRNTLSGQIPQQLTTLTSLEVFNVSYNHLDGLIPQGEQFSTFDNWSFAGNTGLCGSPMSKKCGKTDSSSPAVRLPRLPVTDDEEDDSSLIDWIIRLLGCASGCIVGFVLGKYYITDRHHGWFMTTFGRTKQPTKIVSRALRSSS